MLQQQESHPLFLPLLFEENCGQMDADRHFSASSSHGTFYIHPGAISTVLIDKKSNAPTLLTELTYEPALPDEEQMVSGVVLALSFVGANEKLVPKGMEPTDTKLHYLQDTDPANWKTDISAFLKVCYNKIWEGIDLELCGGEDGLKMYWQLDSPQRISSIHLRWDGGDALSLEADGSLLLKHALGELRDPAPFAWQMLDGKRVTVDCAFSMKGDHEFGFAISGTYDESLPLVIDPLLPYATYLGGAFITEARGIAADDQGCAYVTGATASADFPTTPGAFQTSFTGSSSAFITKIAPDGTSLIYSTFLGGDQTLATGIAVDALGYAYVTGSTNSATFPITPGAYQTVVDSSGSVFVTKLAQDGASLIFSTFLGVAGSSSITTDDQGYVYVAGQTTSASFPVTPGAFQTVLQGIRNAFVTKFTPDGGNLAYSTYLGGDDDIYCFSIAVDSQYSAYVTGYAMSNDFPVTPGAFQTTLQGTVSAFITKFSMDGSSLIYSTYLGGSNATYGYGISVNTQGNAYVTGSTTSSDFPVTPGAFQAVIPGSQCAYITAFSEDGESLLASTYLGGSTTSGGIAIALDSRSRAYITGSADDADFPTTPNVIPSSFSGSRDIIVSILTPDLTTLLVSFFIGGNSSDSALDIALGQHGDVYTAGKTDSTDFPVTPDAIQPTLKGMFDGYVTRNIFYFIEIQRASLSIIKLS